MSVVLAGGNFSKMSLIDSNAVSRFSGGAKVSLWAFSNVVSSIGFIVSISFWANSSEEWV